MHHQLKPTWNHKRPILKFYAYMQYEWKRFDWSKSVGFLGDNMELEMCLFGLQVSCGGEMHDGMIQILLTIGLAIDTNGFSM